MIRLLLVLVALLLACGGGGTAEPEPASAEKQLYTCSMDPQVIRDAPGTCPICGMDLTPMRGTGPAAQGERKIKYWRAPMDPTYIRDAPGKSPMGMDLVPVYEDELEGPAAVQIDPGVVQQIGVETAPVRRTTVFRHLRTIGEVDVGEDELSVVNLRVSGWIEKIRVDRTGDQVRAGQVLFELYSPELVAAQDELLLAIRTQGADSDLARSARRKLANWDVADADVDAMIAAGHAQRTVPIRAPANGYVLHKDVIEGARVQAGKDLYRIGNLKRIWVTAEVYEHDAPWVSEGQAAQMELSNAPGEVVQGRVSYVYPTLNPKTRTLPVRLEFDNPGVRLKPGMFATVYIEYRRKDDVIAVPTSAILHSGRRELVFVALGGGRFSAREVATGLVGDHALTEVLSGLEPGEEVVISGQFLIDSESQLQEAIRKISGGASTRPAEPETVYSCPMHPDVVSDAPGTCPECGMALEQRPGTAAELERIHADHAAQPGQYACPMHPDVIQDDPGRCPKCGMFLEKQP